MCSKKLLSVPGSRVKHEYEKFSNPDVTCSEQGHVSPPSSLRRTSPVLRLVVLAGFEKKSEALSRKIEAKQPGPGNCVS